VFDFLNGFHDAANSIATVVSTRVLTPTQAVLWAAFFNFIAAFAFGTGVAQTIGSGLVHTEFVDVYVVFAGLAGAIIWNILTWLLSLPTSSSHALVSGIAGAAIARAGIRVVILSGWVPLGGDFRRQCAFCEMLMHWSPMRSNSPLIREAIKTSRASWATGCCVTVSATHALSIST